jgi:hypothetical protein
MQMPENTDRGILLTGSQFMSNSPNNDNAKYQSKFSGGKQHSFILSQNRKRKLKPGELDSEDMSDIALAFGSSGAEATKVSEETHTYQDGSWH